MQASKIKLKLFLAVWKRPEITELCFLGIQRLKTHPSFDISAFAVISEVDMIGLCEKYDIDWIITENLPLGKKKNFGLRQLSYYDFDFMMEIGSDDLVTNNLLTQYLPYFEKYDFFGISDVAYIESENGECRRLIADKTTYGAGRVISKDLLEKMDYQIWAGPALGAFNAWAKGSYLDDYRQRSAVDLAKHLMTGAAYQARINLLLAQGATIPVSLQRWKPLGHC